MKKGACAAAPKSTKRQCASQNQGAGQSSASRTKRAAADAFIRKS